MGAPALRLKKALAEAFAGTTIDCHAATSTTSKIEVAWVENGSKNIVWSKNKTDTENGHAVITQNLKTAQ